MVHPEEPRERRDGVREEQRAELVVAELVIVGVRGVVIDARGNVVLPPAGGPPLAFRHEEGRARLTIYAEPYGTLDYVPGHFTLYAARSRRVGGIFQPAALQRLQLWAATLAVETPDASLARLAEVELQAGSSLTLTARIGDLRVSVSSGSKLCMPAGAPAGNLRVCFLDANPGNLIQAAYHGHFTDESTTGRRGELRVQRACPPPAPLPLPGRPLQAWAECRPARTFNGTGNACCVCMAKQAAFTFTVCRCPTLCSQCVTAALDSGLVGARVCPYCRAHGAPAVDAPTS